jgi:hypothetical protein
MTNSSVDGFRLTAKLMCDPKSTADIVAFELIATGQLAGESIMQPMMAFDQIIIGEVRRFCEYRDSGLFAHGT